MIKVEVSTCHFEISKTLLSRRGYFIYINKDYERIIYVLRGRTAQKFYNAGTDYKKDNHIRQYSILGSTI